MPMFSRYVYHVHDSWNIKWYTNVIFQLAPEQNTHVVVDITSMYHGDCLKTKIDAECHAFQEKWTNDYFLFLGKRQASVRVMRKANLKHHYSLKLINWVDYEDQCTQSLGAQQAAFTRPHSIVVSRLKWPYDINRDYLSQKAIYNE